MTQFSRVDTCRNKLFHVTHVSQQMLLLWKRSGCCGTVSMFGVDKTDGFGAIVVTADTSSASDEVPSQSGHSCVLVSRRIITASSSPSPDRMRSFVAPSSSPRCRNSRTAAECESQSVPAFTQRDTASNKTMDRRRSFQLAFESSLSATLSKNDIL